MSFLTQFSVPSGEKKKLKYSLKLFNVFTDGSEDGVILKIKTNFHSTFRWDNKYRTFEPEIGEFVGLLTHTFFQVFQVYAVGVIVAKHGNEVRPTYDVFVVDVDPLEWKQISSHLYLGTRETKVAIGRKKYVSAKEVVTLSCDKDRFDQLLSVYQQDIDSVIRADDDYDDNQVFLDTHSYDLSSSSDDFTTDDEDY